MSSIEIELLPPEISLLTINMKSSKGLKTSLPSEFGVHEQRYSVKDLNASSEPYTNKSCLTFNNSWNLSFELTILFCLPSSNSVKTYIYSVIISLVLFVRHIAFKYFSQLCPHLPFTSHYSYSNSNYRCQDRNYPFLQIIHITSMPLSLENKQYMMFPQLHYLLHFVLLYHSL